MPAALSRRALASGALCLSFVLPLAAAAEGKLDDRPADFAKWWPKFQAAVAKGDKPAVAAMARFPMDWENGKLRAIASREVFLAQYGAVITPEIAKAIAQGKPEPYPGGSYNVTWQARGNEYALSFAPAETHEFYLQSLSEGPA
jgi:hypothetical protein